MEIEDEEVKKDSSKDQKKNDRSSKTRGNGKSRSPKSSRGGMNKTYDEKKSKERKDKSEGAPKDKGIPWKNDWSFYAINEQIAKDIGSIPYNTVPGVPITYTYGAQTFKGSITGSLPSVIALRYVPTVGASSTYNSGINMAAKQLYTYVRHANSGARNYEAADLIMYVMAMRDIYTQWFELKRAIGVANSYYIMNRNLPDAILAACHIDAADLRANVAQYRGQLNLLCEKINAFAVPKYFKAFDRAAYISSYYFFDSTSRRSQSYVYHTFGGYTWSGTTNPTGTQLTFAPYSTDNTNLTVQSYINILNTQLDALFLDEDANTMSGDILKAFGDQGLYQITNIPTDYVVEGVYDEDILAQIENSKAAVGGINPSWTASSCHTDFAKVQLNVTQENQLITFDPHISVSSNYPVLPDFVFFNSHKDDPTFMDNIEWSRNITMGWYDGISKIGFTFGLELLGFYEMFYYNPTDNIYAYYEFANDMDTTSMSIRWQMIAMLLEQWDWHPAQYFVDTSFNSTSQPPAITVSTVPTVSMDLKVYTILNFDIVRTMHDNATYAAFFARGLYGTKNQ